MVKLNVKLKPGQVKIAEGRDGYVYLHEDKTYVTKVFKSAKKCKQEERALKMLQTTGIAPRFVSSTNTTVTMKYISGKTLFEYVKSQRGKPAPKQIEDSLIKVMKVLQEKSIDPNDNNLYNYIITEDNCVVRLDFSDWKPRPPKTSELMVTKIYHVFPRYAKLVLESLEPSDPFLKLPLIQQMTSFLEKTK